MNGVMKALTGILGVMAVVACLATVAIIGYSFINGGKPSPNNAGNNVVYVTPSPDSNMDVAQVPTTSPDVNAEATNVPLRYDPNHIHDYKPTVIQKANCYNPGQIKYECICGDYYVVDQLSTGHVPDEWEITVPATSTSEGTRVRRCIYCDEIVASETIPATGTGTNTSKDGDSDSNIPPHEHLYAATVEREPTCTQAGLRKLTCSCGNFYTETIPAVGHVATDWETAEEATATSYGTSQRVCNVCGALLDTKVLPLASPTPNASASPGSSASAAPSSTPSSGTPAPSGTPKPTPTPHVHSYKNYVVTPATCTEKGVRSYICSCGSSYAESIELDLNNHKYMATFVAPTNTQQGYTVYTCTRCNYSYMDNYIMPLTNQGSSEEKEGDE